MIGLKRGTVKLIQYNEEWPKIFDNEKKLLQSMFGNKIIAVEHIGSTAIPGMIAKPIIDMDIGVESLEIARSMKEKFEKLGYEHRPVSTNEELKWQELFVKGSEAKRTHHAHVTIYENNYWKNDLLFRDYLRKNPNRAKQYAELKQELAEKYANDRETYTNNKENFINETLDMARKGRVN